jgi:hypothetical protein
LLIGILRRGGALLASALVIVAAVASLFGPEPVEKLVGSGWFLAAAAILFVSSLVSAVVAVSRRSWSGVLQHLGMVIALVGVGIRQRTSHDGYLFLEQAAGGRNYCLSSNLRRLEELPGTFALDSLTSRATRGFQPAPVAWVMDLRDSVSRAVTYNHPFTVGGRQLLLARLVEPGFLDEYEVTVSGGQYLALHNQMLEPVRGLSVWSFAFDAAANKVGLAVGSETVWLGVGDSLEVAGTVLKLSSATFARNAGAIFFLNDIRFRLLIFLGFGLLLLGLLPPLFIRKEP